MISVPPPNVTWPMVAYAFVRDLPHTFTVLGGVALGIVLVEHAPGQVFAPIGAVLAPAIVSALARSRPTDPLTAGGPLSLILLSLKAKMGAMLGMLVASSALCLAACTPAQTAAVEASAQRDLAAALGAERVACLAARFLPGTARGDAIAACDVGEALTDAADQFLTRVEAKRKPAAP